MAFKNYDSYNDFFTDLEALYKSHDLHINNNDLQWFNYDLEHLIKDYTEYMKGFENIEVIYKNPIHNYITNENVKSEIVNFSEIPNIFTNFKITFKDIEHNLKNSSFYCSFNDFTLVFSSRHTAKNFSHLLKNDDSWELQENFSEHIFLHEKIVNELKEIRLGKELNKTEKKTKSKLSNPEKIAVLYNLGIEETLNKFPIKEDRYRFIHELIGGNYDNIKSIMRNGVSNDNKRVAQDFINSKTI